MTAAPTANGVSTSGVVLEADTTTRNVQEYYGKTLQSSKDLKTSACCSAVPPSARVRGILAAVPDEVMARFYGCGSPLPLGIDGLNVLDLGSGSGRDCYVAAALVGPSGSVTGVDMTDEQLAVARAHTQQWASHLGYANLRFVRGRMERLDEAGIADASVDLVISNCVVNLSPDKRAVLAEAFRVLKHGGEFHFSDVYADRRLAQSARQDPVLVGECLGGALYEQDFLRLCRDVGFADPRVVSRSPVAITDEAVAAAVGGASFWSVTYRLFKLPPGRLETLCEDYGQYAVYKGTIKGAPHAYALDDHHMLQTGKPFLVCGNTAAMLSETWLAPHFTVVGDRSVHYGACRWNTGKHTRCVTDTPSRRSVPLRTSTHRSRGASVWARRGLLLTLGSTHCSIDLTLH